jgi:hypothetical protein
MPSTAHDKNVELDPQPGDMRSRFNALYAIQPSARRRLEREEAIVTRAPCLRDRFLMRFAAIDWHSSCSFAADDVRGRRHVGSSQEERAMRFRQVGMAIAAMVLIAGAVHAQNVTSRLTGTVRDAQGAVLPGVTVTATSPALIGTQTAVTEANGTYQFPSLPSGVYTLKFELQGFQPFMRQNIALALGQTLTIDTQMQLASLKENVTVTAESPVVDTQSTTVGSTMDTAKLIGVPSSTDLWGALAQAPGIRMEGFDVGGSHKSQQSGYTAFGIGNQTRVVTEGVDTTEGTGGAGFYQDYYSQNEISVSGAGQDVAMNTPGAAVISTIKSGGNQFKALINQTYEGESFVGDNADDADRARGGSAQPNRLFWEHHSDLGGPILKDRLWFFAAYNHFHIDKQISGVDPSVATDLGIFDNFTTKETWKPSSKDTLIGYYQWGNKQKPLRGLSVTRGPDSTLAQTSPSWMFNGKWERVWTNRLFTEFNGGNFGYDFPEKPSVDFRTNPPRTDLVTGEDTGAGFTQGGTSGPFELERAKPQAFGSATYYLPTSHAGSHDFKVGFEWIDDMANFGSIGTSGPILYLDSRGAIDEIRLTNLGDPSQLGSSWTIPQDSNQREALYAQDRWTANSRVTVTAGIRYDRQAPYYITGKTDPLLTEVFTATTLPGKTLFTRNNIAPRVGVSFDPMGDGRTAIKAFWGRYYYNFADSFSTVNPTGASTKTFKFLDQNHNRLYDGPQELGQLVSSTGGVSTTYDPDIDTPYTEEVDASIQRQFWGESSVRVSYVRKMSRSQFTGNNTQSLNQSWVGQFTVPVTVGVPLDSVAGVGPTQTFTVFDVPDALAGVVNNIIANIPGDGGDWNYDTIEVAFNKRFSRGLFLDSSFDWTRADDLQSPWENTNDPLQQSNVITPPDYFENPFPSVSNRQKTTTWGFHVSSRYELPYQVGVGVNLQVQSGWNYARIVSVDLPNAGTQRFWMENLDNNRSDTVPLLNVRFDKAFTFYGHRLTGMVDLFNITNANPVTNFNLLNGSRFNQINGILDPRTVQLGIRFEF